MSLGLLAGLGSEPCWGSSAVVVGRGASASVGEGAGDARGTSLQSAAWWPMPSLVQPAWHVACDGVTLPGI